ncbi:fused MFS/spermidine synthase [Silvimonas amylolytica]|uniref:Polyamine aminopropyltransferase n=1 Tax=Silvimonas amylolytica TaxID=449663 RepID=A0ABQ2PKE4_9NEIS|nr:fused MFS/spermidine synthase [Silvimonas amylolytica]GGP26082.1 polyamine aminopropyltransferase [Silvimonas amylolytica]
MLFRSKRISPAAQTEIQIDISDSLGIRKLHFGGDDTQSAMRVSDPIELVLAYTRCLFGFLLFNPHPRKALLIGLGGGSIAKWMHEKMPSTHLTAVELHPQVVAVARSMFQTPADDEHLDVIVGDGAAHVYAMPDASTDLIIMDAYSATGIAEPLATADFFSACRDRLTDDGVLVVNLWGSDRHFETYRDRLSAAFSERILLLPARQKGNVLAFCFVRSQNSPGWATLADRAAQLKATYGLEFDEFVSDLARLNPHNDRKLFI